MSSAQPSAERSTVPHTERPDKSEEHGDAPVPRSRRPGLSVDSWAVLLALAAAALVKLHILNTVKW